MSGLKDKMSAAEFREYLKTNEATSQRKARTEKSKPKKKINDAKLWKIFSQFIRLKFSDEKGFCSCYTCGRVAFWRQMDCGHGIMAHHLATKYEEKNNRPQCGRCNAFEGGRRETFKERMDKDHGAGTWDLMELRSKSPLSYSDFEIETMISFYTAEVNVLKKEKGLN